MFSKEFWMDASERALKTFLQGILAVLVIDGTTLLNAQWQGTLVVAATAAVVSLLTSVVSSAAHTTADDATASVINAITYKK